MTAITQSGDIGPAELDAKVRVVQVAEAVVAGNPLYKDTNDSDKRKVANFDTEDEAVISGIALTPASAQGFSVELYSGKFLSGANTHEIGQLYFAVASGGLAIHDDITTGKWIGRVFEAITDEIGKISISNQGTQVP